MTICISISTQTYIPYTVRKHAYMFLALAFYYTHKINHITVRNKGRIDGMVFFSTHLCMYHGASIFPENFLGILVLQHFKPWCATMPVTFGYH